MSRRRLRRCRCCRSPRLRREVRGSGGIGRADSGRTQKRAHARRGSRRRKRRRQRQRRGRARRRRRRRGAGRMWHGRRRARRRGRRRRRKRRAGRRGRQRAGRGGWRRAGWGRQRRSRRRRRRRWGRVRDRENLRVARAKLAQNDTRVSDQRARRPLPARRRGGGARVAVRAQVSDDKGKNVGPVRDGERLAVRQRADDAQGRPDVGIGRDERGVAAVEDERRDARRRRRRRREQQAEGKHLEVERGCVVVAVQRACAGRHRARRPRAARRRAGVAPEALVGDAKPAAERKQVVPIGHGPRFALPHARVLHHLVINHRVCGKRDVLRHVFAAAEVWVAGGKG